jgi:thiol-disulfide isomerase/thioredoxin
MSNANDQRSAPRLSRVAGLVVVAVAIGLLVTNGIWLGLNCGGMRAPRRGEVAPAFALKDLAGKGLSSTKLRGKVLVLDFWATWCPPCVAKYPSLEALADAHYAAGLRVLAISVDRERRNIERFVTRRAAARKAAGKAASSKISVLRASGGVSAAYGVHTLPHVVVVDRQGRLRYVHIGRSGGRALEAAVKRALTDP